MKPSLDQLPANKQHEILAIVEIIIKVVDPEKVILFGSYAKNSYVENQYVEKNGTKSEYISDYDFLVVTKDSQDKPYKQETRILELAGHIEPPINLEIHEINYVNTGLEYGEYFWVDIIKEGIVLFDKGTVSFVEPRELTLQERKQKAQEYYDTWFPQAKENILDAEAIIARGNFKKADFELHQATESLYYAVLLVFTDYKPRIHNLWKLRKKAKTYSEELYLLFRTDTDPEEERLFELLKQGYVDARYKSKFSVSENDIRTLYARINQMVTTVEKICVERITNMS